MDIAFVGFNVEKWEVAKDKFQGLQQTMIEHRPYVEHKIWPTIPRSTTFKFQILCHSVFKTLESKKIIFTYTSTDDYFVEYINPENQNEAIEKEIRDSFKRHVDEYKVRSKSLFTLFIMDENLTSENVIEVREKIIDLFQRLSG